MTIAAILKHKGQKVISVGPTARVSDIVRVLTGRGVGAALVLDDEEQLLGIVTEHDIVRTLAANGSRALEMAAGQLMTRIVHTVTSRTGIEEAMTTMTTKRVRYLPVLEHGTLLGIVSVGDLVKARVIRQEERPSARKAYALGAV